MLFVLECIRTIRLDAIDKALLRPGRFHEILQIGLPTYEDRRELFKLFTSRMPLVNDTTTEQLAELHQSLTAQLQQHGIKSSHDDITALLANEQLSDGMTCADIEVILTYHYTVHSIDY
jgi:SpoVK/Ycf46/Vps4 family AAA+-type ATPase